MSQGNALRPASEPAAAGAELCNSDIHVWTARLDVAHTSRRQLERTLSPDERERIGRLRADSDRLRAAASRGLLRHVLAGYAGIPPAELRFTYGGGGKPGLRPSTDREPLHFNTAHSGDLLVVAVGRAPFLGVDIERLRPIVRWERVARRAFSSGERQEIEALAPDRRTEAFLNCWTRKEACVKAVGEGVWSAFGRFEVSLIPGDPAEVRSVDGRTSRAAEWSLYHLEPAPGFVGALAVRGAGLRLWTGTLPFPEAAT